MAKRKDAKQRVFDVIDNQDTPLARAMRGKPKPKYKSRSAHRRNNG